MSSERDTCTPRGLSPPRSWQSRPPEFGAKVPPLISTLNRMTATVTALLSLLSSRQELLELLLASGILCNIFGTMLFEH
ncbi:hypothetical protein F0562_031157 [Nyssa sinensis]|uniref:Uncharacterized protein n=1 Tax=Nyssa sinensis TaxID=561372 RepID=A0A5J5ASV4_9ASTE|nr:hypothetical protein F0562_031157 [Nyssa sinensis]